MTHWKTVPDAPGQHPDVAQCGAALCGAYVRGQDRRLAHDQEFHTAVSRIEHRAHRASDLDFADYAKDPFWQHETIKEALYLYSEQATRDYRGKTFSVSVSDEAITVVVEDAPEADEYESGYQAGVRYMEDVIAASAAQLSERAHNIVMQAMSQEERHPCVVKGCNLNQESHHALAYGMLAENRDLKRRLAELEGSS